MTIKIYNYYDRSLSLNFFLLKMEEDLITQRFEIISQQEQQKLENLKLSEKLDEINEKLNIINEEKTAFENECIRLKAKKNKMKKLTKFIKYKRNYWKQKYEELVKDTGDESEGLEINTDSEEEWEEDNSYYKADKGLWKKKFITKPETFSDEELSLSEDEKNIPSVKRKLMEEKEYAEFNETQGGRAKKVTKTNFYKQEKEPSKDPDKQQNTKSVQQMLRELGQPKKKVIKPDIPSQKEEKPTLNKSREEDDIMILVESTKKKESSYVDWKDASVLVNKKLNKTFTPQQLKKRYNYLVEKVKKQ